MATKTASKNYTKPELRDKIKDKVVKGDKGGKPGQWSARKAQLVASEYKKEGGDYTTKKADASGAQKSLKKWGNEDWRTADGKKAGKPDGKTDRYLPAEAWKKLSAADRKETRAKKLSASVEKQFVQNAPAAKKAGASARKSSTSKSTLVKKMANRGHEPFEGYADMKAADIISRVKDVDKRKVRSIKTYEEKNANRKGVLAAVEKRLA